jgi:phenylacetate-CoA ligase
MEIPFWNKEIETMDREQLEKHQLTHLRETIDSALNTPFYKKRFGKIGLGSGKDIKSMEDFKKLPFTTKDDLRECYPDALLAVNKDEVVRIHTSSGTTGVPTVIYHTQEDLDHWTNLVSRSLIAAGCTRKDVFQNMMTYGMFTGGLGLHYGAERMGMTVIPIGGGNTMRQLKLMKDFKTTVIHITPSYCLHVHENLAEAGVTRDSLSLKKAICGGEPHTEDVRRKIQEMWGIDVYNCYGMSEMNGPGVGFECICKAGLHMWEDNYILEIIDPKSGDEKKDGEQGEVVLTTLLRKATPLIRYRSRDLAHIIPGKCECGRTHRLMSRIMGRCDDMLIINGVNIYPAQIEEVIMKVPEVGNNYQILVEKNGTLDKLTVKVEIYSKMFTGDISAMETLRSKIKDHLKASIVINPVVELHEPGSLPAFEGKAKRVIDNRNNN